MTGSLGARHLGGALGCGVVGLAGLLLPAIAVAALVLAVLVAVIGAEHHALTPHARASAPAAERAPSLGSRGGGLRRVDEITRG
jgi:hypothetical protein